MPATEVSLQPVVVKLIAGHLVRLSSVPLQLVFEKTIGISPEPNLEPLMAYPPICGAKKLIIDEYS